jgi:hypothetical protein
VGEIAEQLAASSSHPKEYPCLKKASALACLKKKEKKERKNREKKKEKERRKEWERTGNLHIKFHPVLVPHTQAAHARIQSRNCFASFSSLCCSTQHAIAAAIPRHPSYMLTVSILG